MAYVPGPGSVPAGSCSLRVVWPPVLLVMAWLLVLARPRIAGLAAAVRAVAGLDGTAVVGRRPLRLRASARCSWRELSVSPDTY